MGRLALYLNVPELKSVNHLSRIAIIELTNYSDGAIASMVVAFTEAAKASGHQVASTLADADYVCSCGGCCGDSGCGDDDCLCTFSKESVDVSDIVVFAFPCDTELKMSQLKHVVSKSIGKCAPSSKKLMLISCSPSFDDSIFSKVIEFFREICISLDWEYAGDALVEGLPDACQGGDPISKKKAVALVKLLQ